MDKQRIQQIKDHEAAADAAEQDAEKHRWEAARLIAEELASGTKQADLARAIGKSRQYIYKMNKVWEKFGGTSSVPRFWDAFRKVAGWDDNNEDIDDDINDDEDIDDDIDDDDNDDDIDDDDSKDKGDNGNDGGGDNSLDFSSWHLLILNAGTNLGRAIGVMQNHEMNETRQKILLQQLNDLEQRVRKLKEYVQTGQTERRLNVVRRKRA